MGGACVALGGVLYCEEKGQLIELDVDGSVLLNGF